MQFKSNIKIIRYFFQSYNYIIYMGENCHQNLRKIQSVFAKIKIALYIHMCGYKKNHQNPREKFDLFLLRLKFPEIHLCECKNNHRNLGEKFDLFLLRLKLHQICTCMDSKRQNSE